MTTRAPGPTTERALRTKRRPTSAGQRQPRVHVALVALELLRVRSRAAPCRRRLTRRDRHRPNPPPLALLYSTGADVVVPVAPLLPARAASISRPTLLRRRSPPS